MCGICGFVNFGARKLQDPEGAIRRMNNALSHRGPDDEGYFQDGNVFLGHRRLSIIDLKTGHQPMTSEDKRFTIVFNGEIYNFQELKQSLHQRGAEFQTVSDTETILAAYVTYGRACLIALEGMFAFAIWDAHTKTLFLARDRFGKKPLYYANIDGFFLFASELKSLLTHPFIKREIDYQSLSKYLAYDYVPNPQTIFKQIKQVEPAHYLIVSQGKITQESYWDITNARTTMPHTFDDAKDRVFDLLKYSVQKRLVSDVPLGVFLSGGIDSSAIVAMMAKLMPAEHIKTFSIGFKEKSFDESSDARFVAQYFHTDHHEEVLDASVMLDVIDEVLSGLDAPFADASIIPTYLVSRFARKSVKVVLGGDGGDELFFGYPTFKAHRYQHWYAQLPGFLKAMIRFSSEQLPSTFGYMNAQFLSRKFLKGFDYSSDIRNQVWLGVFAPEDQKKLLCQGGSLQQEKFLYSEVLRSLEKVKARSVLTQQCYLYLKTYLVDDILTKVDRASMACSLEVRAPFLDTELAEFVFSLPENYKLRGLNAKYILKKALENHLPQAIINKKKHGFGIPVAQWFRGELREPLLDMLNDERIKRQGIFNSDYIRTLVDEHLKGKCDRHRELWSLFVFQKWHDRWIK